MSMSTVFNVFGFFLDTFNNFFKTYEGLKYKNKTKHSGPYH